MDDVYQLFIFNQDIFKHLVLNISREKWETTTIDDIKDMIIHKERSLLILKSTFTLYCSDKPLYKSMTLRDYNINPETMLNMRLHPFSIITNNADRELSMKAYSTKDNLILRFSPSSKNELPKFDDLREFDFIIFQRTKVIDTPLRIVKMCVNDKTFDIFIDRPLPKGRYGILIDLFCLNEKLSNRMYSFDIVTEYNLLSLTIIAPTGPLKTDYLYTRDTTMKTCFEEVLQVADMYGKEEERDGGDKHHPLIIRYDSDDHIETIMPSLTLNEKVSVYVNGSPIAIYIERIPRSL